MIDAYAKIRMLLYPQRFFAAWASRITLAASVTSLATAFLQYN